MRASPITSDRIIEIANAFRGSKVLLSAVELGVFTALSEGPLDAESLSARIGIGERGSRDFFDALVALDLLQRDAGGRYANSPACQQFLVREGPSYIGGLLQHFNEREYPSWRRLTAALRTGKPQFSDSEHGLYSALYAEPDSAAGFAAAMTGGTLPVAKALAEKFPWNQYSTFIDVGAAEGCLPVQVATVHRHLRGGGFDLPVLSKGFEAYVASHQLSDRLRFYPGDFLHHALPSADVLIMGRVLHNWDLPTRRMLLAKAYAALPNDGVLIVYERLIDNDRQASLTGLLASLNMLVMTPAGSDFSAAECSDWMRSAGFRDIQVRQLTSDQTAVIGLK